MPRPTPIKLDGVTYPSLSAAARALGVSRQAVWQRAHPEAFSTYPRQHCSGESPARRLSDDEVQAIERAHQVGESISAIAREVNVNYTTAWDIVHGRRKGRQGPVCDE